MEDMEIKRGPGRPKAATAAVEVDTMRNDLRPVDLRESDPQEAARLRAAEILSTIGNAMEEQDEFFVPEELKHPDWDLQWKRYSVYNAEDHGYISSLQRTGWQFVPATRRGFERFVPRGWKETFILKKGMVLMERPREVSELIESRQLGAARESIKIAEQRNGQAPPGTLPRENSGRPIAVNGVAGARRTIGPIPN